MRGHYKLLNGLRIIKSVIGFQLIDMRLDQQYKWLKPRIPMWRHVQVDGDFGVGGRLRDKVDEMY